MEQWIATYTWGFLIAIITQVKYHDSGNVFTVWNNSTLFDMKLSSPTFSSTDWFLQILTHPSSSTTEQSFTFLSTLMKLWLLVPALNKLMTLRWSYTQTLSEQIMVKQITFTESKSISPRKTYSSTNIRTHSEILNDSASRIISQSVHLSIIIANIQKNVL